MDKERLFMDIIMKLVEFINSIIDKIKAFVAEVRSRNDAGNW